MAMIGPRSGSGLVRRLIMNFEFSESNIRRSRNQLQEELLPRSYRFIPEIDRQRSCQVDVEYSRFTYRLQM